MTNAIFQNITANIVGSNDEQIFPILHIDETTGDETEYLAVLRCFPEATGVIDTV